MSTQAELAGRTAGPSYRPNRGQSLRNFTLPSVSGDRVSTSAYYGKENLVVLFTSPGAKLLRELAANYPALREEQTEVLAVVEALGPDFLPVEPSTGTKLAFPFPILLDRDGSSHKLAGADRRRQALYIADRFGEVFGAFRESEGSAIPSVAEIIEQVRFINIQCDECAHPEWPPV